MAMRRPRIRRMARGDRRARSSPSNSMLPPTIRPAGGSKPTIERQVVVLPHPDSPTRPRVSPSSRAKLTPSTALMTRVPRKVKKCVCKSEPCSSGLVITFHHRWTQTADARRSTRIISVHLRLSGVPILRLYNSARSLQVSQLRIKPHPQPVAEELRGQHNEDDASSGKDRQPPLARHQRR